MKINLPLKFYTRIFLLGNGGELLNPYQILLRPEIHPHLSFGRTVIVLVGIYFLTASSKILRKLEYTSVILSELKTRSFQFVIFISSASPSMT
jgi:hypothetical protein